jgi:glycosyltransferase involved in cell wall biosynthesis
MRDLSTPLRIGIVTSAASRLNGGVFEAVVEHCKMLREIGMEPTVFALADAFSEEDRHRFEGIPVSTAKVWGPASIGIAPRLVRNLLLADLDCVHLHGIWMFPSLAATIWAKITKKPYLISPHGMLDPWITARGRLKKAAAEVGYERASWRAAHLFHGLTQAEADDIRRVTGQSSVVVVPNAGPKALKPSSVKHENFVYLGRIHPKKNLDVLIDAWVRVKRQTKNGATLKIAGWGSEADVSKFRDKLSDTADDSIEFLGPVYGEKKLDLIANARFLVLPSLSEGLPIVILEAWAAGVPTLMSGNCNLAEGFLFNAATDCGVTVDSVEAALREALTMDDCAWLEMALAAYRLASDNFSSEKISARWLSVYQDLAKGR